MNLYHSLKEKNSQLKKENEDIKNDNDFKKRIKESEKELIFQYSVKKDAKMKDVIDFFILYLEKTDSKNCFYEITHRIIGSDGNVRDRILISRVDLESLKNATRVSTGIVDEYSGYHAADGRGWVLPHVSFSLYRYIV